MLCIMYGVETSICFDWYQGRQRAADRLAELRGVDKNGGFLPMSIEHVHRVDISPAIGPFSGRIWTYLRARSQPPSCTPPG